MNTELKAPKFVEEFANYLVAIRNLSQVYINNMKVTIEQFLEFINIHKFKNKYNSINEMSLNDIRSLNNSDIYSFIFFLAESHYKNNSRVVKIEHLRTFFDYLFRIEHSIFREPFKKIHSERKIDKKLPNYLSLEEAKRLIDLYKNSINPIEIRDSTMLHIFLNCGLRLSEIKNLNIEDINLNDDKFTIIGKGNKKRTNYLNDITKEALLKYLNIRDNSHDKGRNNPLFLTDYGFRMSVTTIKKIVKRAYRKANLDENIYSVHTLRHTCATILYKAGCNIRTIQELLGHVQIDTTEIYTHLHDQEVMDVMLMKEFDGKFDTNNIHSVELNLLDGQVEIILRALELYGYNLDYMLNSNDSSDDTRQEKLALLKYTYEQVLATQAEQIESKSNNTENIPEFGKILIKDGIKNNEIDFKLNVG